MNDYGAAADWSWYPPGDDWYAPCQKLEVIEEHVPFTRQRLASLQLTGAQFGSWDGLQEGCLNTDSVGLSTGTVATSPRSLYLVDDRFYFIQQDARDALPFESNSFDWVYAEHFIEHLTLEDGIQWLREVSRILGPGGLVRLTTPDLRRYAEAYVHDDGFLARHRSRLQELGAGHGVPARKAFMVNQVFMFYGHRWLYDEDEIRFALTQAGFDNEDIVMRAFKDGTLPHVAALDRAVRNDESLYVEATARRG